MYKDYNGRYASAKDTRRPDAVEELSRSCGSLSAAVRAGRRAEAAYTRAPTVPVEVSWRELARVAPTLGIGGPRPALTAASPGDARHVRNKNPVKSRGNRGQTRTLLESHVGINDLSDYACMLTVHMTYYTNNVHRRGAVRKRAASSPAVRAPFLDLVRPIRASQQHPTTLGAGAGRTGAREQRKDAKCGP